MQKIIATIALMLVAACSGKGQTEASEQYARRAIAPAHFAIVPCQSGHQAEPLPCKLLAAGGKFFLMGAPEGALSNLMDHEIKLLDGVLLFSLLPDQVDGLDTVRNTTWRRGRDGPLLVAGPEGTNAFVSGIDSAFEVPDAELFAISPPPGGYDASLMKPREVSADGEAGALVVDTGDLSIIGVPAPSGQIIYVANYEGQSVAIGMCGGPEDQAILEELSETGLYSGCNKGGETAYFVR